MKKTQYVGLFMLFMASAMNHSYAKNFEIAWQTDNVFKAPESVVYDPKSDLLFISNINGAPNEQDGNGFISTLSKTGKLVQLKWVTGLNAPKGLAVTGDKLFVSDINHLVEIDINQGKILQRYEADGAQFLNDVIIDGVGNVYVSDMAANIIFRLNQGVLTPWISGEKLENPNGLLIQGEKMIVASWGKMTEGFNTKVPGHLKEISLKDKSLKSLGNAVPAGNLDGLTSDGGKGYFVTDWMQGGLLHFDAAGHATKVLALNQGSADHTYIEKARLLLIPMMMDGQLIAYTVN